MTATRRPLRAQTKVLPEDGRASNRVLVLQTLYDNDGQSRADVARLTGLTRVTISELVAGLVAEGLVLELGSRGGGTPGKPATILGVNRHAFHIVAIDLSEVGVMRGALVDLRGDVVERRERPIAQGADGLPVPEVGDLIEELLDAATSPVLGIGVGTPGIVGPDGTVLKAPYLGWRDVSLRAELAERFPQPIIISNDANAAALAEFGFGQAGSDLLLVKIGSGVGAGLILGGSPVHGSASAAGEIGHVVVDENGGTCICGKRGCLETWVAIPSLTAALERPGSDREQVLRDAGHALGKALAPVVALLNVTDVIVAAPPAASLGPMLRAATATLSARTLPELHGGLHVRMTELEDIVLRGAAHVVVAEVLGVS